MNGKEFGICDRCGCSNNNTTRMSKFNTDVICMPCKEKEILHPEYKNACDVELSEIKKGNYNFEGVGFPNDLVKV